MAFSEKIRADYIELINEKLDGIPVEKFEDFDAIKNLLNSILTPNDDHITRQDLEESKDSINFLLNNPNEYVERQEDYDEYNMIIKNRILAKIAEFCDMSDQQKQDYMFHQKQDKLQAEKNQENLKILICVRDIKGAFDINSGDSHSEAWWRRKMRRDRLYEKYDDQIFKKALEHCLRFDDIHAKLILQEKLFFMRDLEWLHVHIEKHINQLKKDYFNLVNQYKVIGSNIIKFIKVDSDLIMDVEHCQKIYDVLNDFRALDLQFKIEGHPEFQEISADAYDACRDLKRWFTRCFFILALKWLYKPHFNHRKHNLSPELLSNLLRYLECPSNTFQITDELLEIVKSEYSLMGGRLTSTYYEFFSKWKPGDDLHGKISLQDSCPSSFYGSIFSYRKVASVAVVTLVLALTAYVMSTRETELCYLNTCKVFL